DATLDARLREFDFGEMEGLLFDDLDEVTQSGIITFDGFTAPGGESISTFAARIEDFFGDLPEGHHLIITHGGVIRFLLRRLDHDFRVPPGALVHLSEWSPNRLANKPPS
ncbi:MAG: histidine phosphatase family protein, partial [Actinomycetia bacterium]|nr:histidine phosphatase family protein [Actinomycetes bacterium]